MPSIYYNVKVVALLWVGMLFFVFASGGKRSGQEDRNSRYALMASLSSFLPVVQYSGMLIKTGFGSITWGFPFVSYSGFVVIFLGLLIHLAGITTLNKQWSAFVAISDNHKLVQSGIYALIRHPIYAAVLLELLGFGLALANWVSLGLLLLPNAASLAYRIFVEEKALEKHFGADYIAYQHRTKRLIPGIF